MDDLSKAFEDSISNLTNSEIEMSIENDQEIEKKEKVLHYGFLLRQTKHSVQALVTLEDTRRSLSIEDCTHEISINSRDLANVTAVNEMLRDESFLVTSKFCLFC
jgi:hypothetical protein